MKLFTSSEGVTHNFWQNYTDLMSGLMIIFLIASLGYLVSHDESRKIKAIIRAQKELADSSNSKYFTYNEEYNRFECKLKVDFPAYSQVHNETIASTIPDESKHDLLAAGKKLKEFIQKKEYDGIDFEIIIDGRAARPKDWKKHEAFGAKLGSLRAYNLYKLWKSHGLFDNSKDYIHVAGSGYGGVGRHSKEEDNRTFVISVKPLLKK